MRAKYGHGSPKHSHSEVRRRISAAGRLLSTYLSPKPSARESGRKWDATQRSSALAKHRDFTAALLSHRRFHRPIRPRARFIGTRPSRESRHSWARLLGASLTGMRPVAEFQFMDSSAAPSTRFPNMVAKTSLSLGRARAAGPRARGGYVPRRPVSLAESRDWFVHNPD